MSCPKRPLDGQDPDYEDSIPHETKRLRILEENARAEVSQRVYGIISREFGAELAKREKEVLEIQDRLQEAHKSLHALRFAVVSAFYNKKQNTTDEKQKPIHPAVKKLIGKEPRNWEPLNQRPSKYRPLQGNPLPEPILQDLQPVTKVPRYIPPKMPPRSTPLVPTSPRRGMRSKIKRRIVIGNISKWVPVDTREDSASHKWMMYVRGPKESPDVSGFVSKVRFFLHPSYRPNDIAEVTAPPFHLSRRGWGEFPVRVQIHFTQSQNKPVDLIHHLKLDRTYTGLQTLGAETVVDIWLHSGEEESDKSTICEIANTSDSSSIVKVEHKDESASIRIDNSVSNRVETSGNTSPLSRVSSSSESISPVKEVKSEMNSSSFSERIVSESSGGGSEDDRLWSLGDENVGAVEEVKVEESTSRVVPSLDHDYVANPAPATKLTTLVKCMDNNGRVFFITLGKTGAKPQSQQLKVVSEQTSILRRKLSNPKPENGSSQNVLFMKNGQLYLFKPPRSVLKRPARTELVLNKQNSRQVSVPNRVRYEEALNVAAANAKFPDVALTVRWLLRHMPLTCATAKDPDFRVVHPYAAPDVDTFLQWNIGKQRAAEWLRARAVQSALRKHFSEENVWGLRAIVVWARMHGYTPVVAKLEDVVNHPGPSCSTYSEPVRVMDWLINAQKLDASSDSDNEIDVTSTEYQPMKVKIKQEPLASSDVEVLDVDSDIEPLCIAVRETSRELGFKLEPQEVVPGVLYCAAERILAEAVRLLADDLLRRSLCRAWIRNGSKAPDCILVEDVRSAIVHREELDIFSNRGLGVQFTDTS